MKRLIITIISILISGNLLANVYLEAGAGMNYLDDYKNHVSYGAGFGFNVTDKLLIHYFYNRGVYDGSKLDLVAGINYEKFYKHEYHLVSVQYLYPFPQFQLRVGGSAGAGLISYNYEFQDKITPTDNEEDASGTAYLLAADVIYDLSQRISLFAKLGYLGTLNNGLPYTESSIGGIEIKFGFMISVWGKQKPLY